MKLSPFLLIALTIAGTAAPALAQPAQGQTGAALFERGNLMAWCIVPFDAKKRGPEARAEMLSRMGFTQLAYDWRAEHIPTFDEEIETLARYGIALRAFWFPGALNEEAEAILAALKRHNVQTELWITMGGGEIVCTPEEQTKRVAEHVAAIRPLAERAAQQGCKVGLYNHGSWFGEPGNQIAIVEALKTQGITNVGLVYNQHHGHHHVARFPELLKQMLPYLYCINLNGMEPDGDRTGKKIWPLGSGSQDKELLRTIRDSGYTGPIGILNHTEKDAEAVLMDNLAGLDWIVPQLDGTAPTAPRPNLLPEEQGANVAAPGRSEAFGLALTGGLVAPGNAAFRTPPFTVECRTKLNGAANFNILVANDTKASGTHWEIFTEAGTGRLAVYTPGLSPDHLRTDWALTDGKWRHVAMQVGMDTIALYVDGNLIAEQAFTVKGLAPVPGSLAIGRLVEGGLSCDGAMDDVRISSGLRKIEDGDRPLQEDASTLALWSFDDLPKTAQAPARPAPVEDAARRAALPEFQIIPAADTESLAPAQAPPPGYYTTWQRSHGDAHNTRYAAAREITRENVGQLQQAWIYRSGDGPENVQCNPIVVRDLLIAPTSGQHLVALDAARGMERWRFKPEGRPAHRGLVYWPGDATNAERLLVPAGEYLYALDPTTGAPLDAFGQHGRIACGVSVVAPAVYQNVLVVPGYLRDVWGFDVRSGARLWTFHTIPADGEWGRDTWDEPEEGANCWGGMALDETRGIAYISTGSPKDNFAGNTHQGQNLFANCVIALNALTGERLWHFQEIRHDIWDLDLPAPPNLVSIGWKGKRVDAVAQVTKMGNTLLLDRVSGAPLFPFRLRRAPASLLPGERTWPYQPAPELPEPFARVGFTPGDVTERTREAHTAIMLRLASANTGWFAPFEENKGTALYGFHGGAEWTGAAFDPESGRLYVSANNIPWLVTVFRPDPAVHAPGAPPTRGRVVYEELCMKCHGTDRFGVGMAPPLHRLKHRFNDDEVRQLLKTGRNGMPVAEGLKDEDVQPLLDYLFLRDVPAEALRDAPEGELRYTYNGYPKLLDPDGYPGCKPPWGTLNCIDLASGKLVWQVPLGVYPDLAEWGEDDTGAENFGGPTVTAGGVVFCAGAADNLIRGFDSATGAVLWEHKLPFGGYAPPAVYEVGGKEYVVIPATGGGKLGTEKGDAWVAFALP